MRVKTEIRKKLNQFKREGKLDGRTKKIALKIMKNVINFEANNVFVNSHNLVISYNIDDSIDYYGYIEIRKSDNYVTVLSSLPIDDIKPIGNKNYDYKKLNEIIVNLYAKRYL